MAWNWQQPDWPEFTYDAAALEALEHRFLRRSGEFIGAFKHIGPDDRDVLKIELIGDEALKTSEIEGELLNRDSVQASLRQQFGIGNGRIGRAVAEKSLAQNLGQPTLIALAYTIQRKRNAYYAALERNNKANEITDWLAYFAETVLEAQGNTIELIDFYVAKSKFYE